jgi:hypothetical protein
VFRFVFFCNVFWWNFNVIAAAAAAGAAEEEKEGGGRDIDVL